MKTWCTRVTTTSMFFSTIRRPHVILLCVRMLSVAPILLNNLHSTFFSSKCQISSAHFSLISNLSNDSILVVCLYLWICATCHSPFYHWYFSIRHPLWFLYATLGFSNPITTIWSLYPIWWASNFLLSRNLSSPISWHSSPIFVAPN